jgi:hypothetical protein
LSGGHRGAAGIAEHRSVSDLAESSRNVAWSYEPVAAKNWPIWRNFS